MTAMPYVLIVITYLGGSAWGPAVSQQEYDTAKSCSAARQHVIDTVERMNRSNLRGGVSQREIVSAECVHK